MILIGLEVVVFEDAVSDNRVNVCTSDVVLSIVLAVSVIVWSLFVVSVEIDGSVVVRPLSFDD